MGGIALYLVMDSSTLLFMGLYLNSKDGGAQFSFMCLSVCWFILICVYTNPSCLGSRHGPHGGIPKCFIHVRETWKEEFNTVRWSRLACHPVTFLAASHLLIFLFAPPARLGREILYLLAWFTSFHSPAIAERKGFQLPVPSHSAAPQGGQVPPSNPCCGAPVGQRPCLATAPIRPCPSSLDGGPGSGGSAATQPHCPLC